MGGDTAALVLAGSRGAGVRALTRRAVYTRRTRAVVPPARLAHTRPLSAERYHTIRSTEHQMTLTDMEAFRCASRSKPIKQIFGFLSEFRAQLRQGIRSGTPDRYVF